MSILGSFCSEKKGICMQNIFLKNLEVILRDRVDILWTVFKKKKNRMDSKFYLILLSKCLKNNSSLGPESSLSN